MRGMQMNSLWRSATGAVAIGALALTYGCGGVQGATAVRAQEVAGAQNASPVVVSCEPHQRALVRPTVVNGATISQVECVTADPEGAYVQSGYAPAPYAPATAYARAGAVRYVAPRPRYVDEGLGDARIVRTSSSAPVVRTRQVVYDEPVRRSRSKTKSAVIIGSSAGVGAGVGAAVGGKKGALIGAVIGGGGAAIWDQVTRRK
ncbi:MAG: hypothetical protein ABIS06_17100 [Vicinamibacterales bacterium]